MTNHKPSPRGIAHKPVLIGLIGSIILTMIIGICGMAIDPESDLFLQLISTAVLLVVCFSAFTASCAVYLHGGGRIAMSIGSVMITVASATLAAIAWFEDYLDWYGNDILGRCGLACLLLGLAFSHTGVFRAIPARSALRVIKILTMVSAWLFAVPIGVVLLFADVLWQSFSNGIFLFLPFIWLFLLAAVVGTIVVPIATISRANRRELPAESVGSKVEIQLACPKCGHRQCLRTGNVNCGKCGAGIFIEIDEPRCTCGYLLYQLMSNKCPECGLAIPAEMRWADSDAER